MRPLRPMASGFASSDEYNRAIPNYYFGARKKYFDPLSQWQSSYLYLLNNKEVQTMLYLKNLRSWERVLRVVLFSGLATVPIFVAVPYAWLWPVIGVSMAITGVAGWCPACAMAGRKLKE